MIANLRLKSTYDWWIVLLMVVGIYLINNLVLNQGGFISTYILIPTLWCLIAYIVIQLPQHKPAGKSTLRNPLIALAAITAFSQILMSIFAGLFYGFGESPYSFSPTGMLQNFIYATAALFGMELSRAWLINRFSRNHLIPKLVFIAVLYTFISIPLTRIAGTGMDLETTQWVNATFFPALAESMLASYLAYVAGPTPAIVYRGMLQAFTWFCPVLPDLKWMTQALIGTGIPIVGLLITEKLHSPQGKKTARLKQREGKRLSVFLWATTSITVALMILFTIGFLGFHPTVIISGSMSPAIEIGDIIVVDEVSFEDIVEGDVIEFVDGEGTSIVHRVNRILEDGDSSRIFETKGDRNVTPDLDPVHPEQIKGKVLYRIPKIGWISIVVKELFSR